MLVKGCFNIMWWLRCYCQYYSTNLAYCYDENVVDYTQCKNIAQTLFKLRDKSKNKLALNQAVVVSKCNGERVGINI